MAMRRVINQVLKKRPQFQSSLKAPSLLPSFELNPDQEIARSAGRNLLKSFAVLGVGVSGVLSFASVASADGAEHGVACPRYPWPSKGTLNSDPSTERGQKVFQNDCASCHSSLMSYPVVTQAEHPMKSLLAEIEVVNAPSDGGQFITSINGPPTDEQPTKFANVGAYLPKMPIEGAVEYEVATLETESEMEKEATTSSESQVEKRKLVGFKWIFLMSLALLQAAY